MPEIKAYPIPGESKGARLVGVTKDEIVQVLGFEPNCLDDAAKVKHSRGFTVDGHRAGIWDYYGSWSYNEWSVFDPDRVVEALFPGRYKQGIQ